MHFLCIQKDCIHFYDSFIQLQFCWMIMCCWLSYKISCRYTRYTQRLLMKELFKGCDLSNTRNRIYYAINIVPKVLPCSINENFFFFLAKMRIKNWRAERDGKRRKFLTWMWVENYHINYNFICICSLI